EENPYESPREASKPPSFNWRRLYIVGLWMAGVGFIGAPFSILILPSRMTFEPIAAILFLMVGIWFPIGIVTASVGRIGWALSDRKNDPLVSAPQVKTEFCLHCQAECGGPFATDVFGFREFECRACRNVTTLPLPKLYRVVYWLVAFGFVMLSVYCITLGFFPFPGAIVVGAIYALYLDRRVRRANKKLAA